MRICRTVIISALLTLAFSNVSFALKPTLCPTVEQIQDAVSQHEDSIKIPCSNVFAISYPIRNVSDPSGIPWYLLMRVKADFKSETKPKAFEALKTLVFKSGPTLETQGLYICRYTNDLGFETKTLVQL